MKRGFTLIELLVVVLIISILAAIVLPQYQLAVIKSRITRLLPLMKTISKAQQVYYLEHGDYAHNFQLLDIEFPAGAEMVTNTKITYKDFACWLGIVHEAGDSFYGSLYCRDGLNVFELEQYFGKEILLCRSVNNSAIGRRACNSL